MQRVSGKTGGNWPVIVLIVAALVVAVIAVVRLDTTGESGSGLSEAFSFDLSELAKVDPNLILYDESGAPATTGFGQSRAIALGSDGRMYLAGDRAIRVFTKAGAFERQIDLPGEPRCLTVAEDGRIYVGLGDHVEVLGADGQRVASWDPLGEEAVLTSIAKHRDDVFVADAGHRVVLRYDTAGTLIQHIGEKDPERDIPGFFIPSPYFDLAVSRDGLLRVVDPGRNRIDAYTFDGGLEFSWGRRSNDIEGFCGCCNPVNFALLPDGGFVTAEKGLERVKIYDSDGVFAGVVASPAQLGKDKQVKVCNSPAECQGGGLDVAAGADGRVYILDTTDNVVRTFRKREMGQ